jgi:hypothetical protein
MLSNVAPLNITIKFSHLRFGNFIGLIAPELFKSAAAFMRKAVEDIEKDPELRLYSPTNS